MGKPTKISIKNPTEKKGIFMLKHYLEVSEILKIKDNFPNLLFKKIEDIYKVINGISKLKPYIKMTTKNSSHNHCFYG